MLIPREDRLVRIYCQLSEVKPGSDGRFDRSSIKPDMILKAAQKIMSPYELEYKHCDWWTTYQVSLDSDLVVKTIVDDMCAGLDWPKSRHPF